MGASREPEPLRCLIFSRKGIQTAFRLAPAASLLTFHMPEKLFVRSGRPANITPFADLSRFMESSWQTCGGLIFIGATGIAVRAVAPFLRHKSLDPPVVVIDAAARYAISLLAGHLGGANALAATLAHTLGAEPVITTASDACPDVPALDIMLSQAGFRILDWQMLPPLQALLLEEGRPWLCDPFNLLPRHDLFRLSPAEEIKTPGIVADWRRHQAQSGLLRLAWPGLHIGVGFRKNVADGELETGLLRFMDAANLERRSLAALATVCEKEAGLAKTARNFEVQLACFTAEELASVRSPNPSAACGRRFGKEPFSVCEAAALLSAAKSGAKTLLTEPKMVINHSMTFAACVALPERENI